MSKQPADETLIALFNEYLEATELPQMRAMYHDMFNPPYYYYIPAIGRLHYNGKPFKDHLFERIAEKHMVPETLYNLYLMRFKSQAIVGLINSIFKPSPRLDEWVETVNWGSYSHIEKKFLHYYFYLALYVHPAVKGHFGHRLTKIYKLSEFEKYFGSKLRTHEAKSNG